MPSVAETVHSTEARAADGTIETEQRVSISSPVVPFSVDGGRELGRRYLQESTRVSRGFVRARERPGGVDLRLLGFPVSLLRLGPPEVDVENGHATCSYAILGGLLSRGAGGTLCVSQTASPSAELRVIVSGFFARRGLVYRLLQRRLHVAVSRRFFRSVVEGEAP